MPLRDIIAELRRWHTEEKARWERETEAGHSCDAMEAYGAMEAYRSALSLLGEEVPQ